MAALFEKHYALSREVIMICRSMRGHLVESKYERVRRDSKIFQLLLGYRKVQFLKRDQSQIDEIFMDLRCLAATAIAFWLDDENIDKKYQIEHLVDHLRPKYPEQYALSYFSSPERSLAEIDDVVYLLQHDPQFARNYWLEQNNIAREDWRCNDIILSPLSTDYLVAILYLKLMNHSPRLFPVGWMLGVNDSALETQAWQALQDSSENKLYVMVDQNTTTTTSNSIDEFILRSTGRKTVNV